MPWTLRNWVPYSKHAAKRNRPWSEQVARTVNGVARYAKEVDQHLVETQALSGHLIQERDNLRIYYLEFPYVVGASKGVQTKLVRVQHDADPLGSYHGRPISEDELIADLKKHNSIELVSFQKRQLERRRHKR